MSVVQQKQAENLAPRHLRIMHHYALPLSYLMTDGPQGPCMIYAETEDGIRFGGFNSEGFSSSDDYASSFKAFLYCWPKGSEDPVVLNKA